MINLESIKKIADLLSKYPAVSLAYFYGSQVGGAVHAESDLDLALVTSDAHDIDYGEIYSHLCISAVHSKLSL